MNRTPKRLLAVVLALAATLAACMLGPKPHATRTVESGRTIAAGPFEPTWESLVDNYQCPEWFRDAKFGIWAHWSAQCVPEQGDWYARSMYMQGHVQNVFHVANYGHPSTFGFMEIDNLWKAERWDPEKLIKLYKAAGAKYFVALANHEDNFDCYDSKYHEWNSVRVGPRRDIVGTWAKVARANGLRFGVSNHSSHAWHWFQTAYGYDGEGPKAGVRYDAYTLTKADGKGKWWEGLDPQELYTGRNIVMPDGIASARAVRQWHDANNLPWTEEPPPDNPQFVEKWFLRCQDLMDKYRPDLVYMDNSELPMGQTGLDIAAHYYNANMAWHNGDLQAVLTAKGLRGSHRFAVVQDMERSISPTIQPEPFQTDTCIGQWHYKKDIEYKTVGQVARMLADVVSKNGTMLLSIPLRGDGTIDEREEAFLKGFTAWMQVNGEGIYESRPWKIFGEGPTQIPGGRGGDSRVQFTPRDIRFTTKAGTLYAFVLALPTEPVTIQALGLGQPDVKPIEKIRLVGSTEPIRWNQGQDRLTIEKPAAFPCEEVISFQVTFKSGA